MVVDSSVIVKWLNSEGEENITQADKILSDCQKGKIEILTSELAKYEVGNALLYKGMDIAYTRSSLATLSHIPINYKKTSFSDMDDITEIAKTNDITFYDAVFIHLAKKHNGILISANPKHHKVGNKVVIIIDLVNYK